MSYVTVLGIRESDGAALRYGEVENSRAGCLYVWKQTGRHYISPNYTGYEDDYEDSWRLARDPRLTRRDRAVLLWSFDYSWVRRADAAEMASLLREWFAEHSKVVPTLLGVADAYDRVAADPELRGACMYHTSLSGNPWQVRMTYEEARAGDPELTLGQFEAGRPLRPFRFDHDTETHRGSAPFDLFERLRDLHGRIP